MDADEAATAYNKMLAEVIEYLREVEAPSSIIEKMTSTGSSEITWIKDEPQNRPASIEEWTKAACGSVTDQEFETFIKLFYVRQHAPLPTDKQLLERMLNEKIKMVRECERKLISSNRDRLPPP